MIAAIAILLAASAFRVWLWATEGGKWSAADETVMARLGLAASQPHYSYRRACHQWLEEPRAANWPGIVRYANVLLLGLLYRLTRRNNYYIPSGVATAASIGTLWLSWLLVGSGSPWAALVVALSPLQLHLGRRALQDQLVCCTTLAALYAGLHGHLAIAAVLVGAVIAVKETTAIHTLAIGAAWLVAGVPLWHVVASLGAGCWLYFFGFVALTREPLLLWKLGKRLTNARLDSYGIDHQQGAFHRLPVDFFLLAPMAFVLAVRTGALGPVAAFAVVMVAVQSVFPVLRSARMVTAADAAMHVLAATAVGPVAALAVAATNTYIFWRVFQRGEQVYDPVNANLVVALGFAPKRSYSS